MIYSLEVVQLKKLFNFMLKSKARMWEATFGMLKWSSNPPQLMERIKSPEGTNEISGSGASSVKEKDQSYTDCTLGEDHVVDEAEEDKVLGIIWNHSSDQLRIDLNKVVENAKLLPPTK